MEHENTSGLPVMLELSDFARAFALRAPRVSVFLGAGASVSSGVPSAGQLVREFQRDLYAGDTRIHPSRVASLVDPRVEATIQRHFATRAGYPPSGADQEYSFYFERAYPDPADRRLFISHRLAGSRPSYGYFCLGAILVAGKVRFVWTTNFDDLVEQGFAVVSGGRAPSLLGRDTSKRLETAIRDERFPVVAKLHGDFRYDALQNTSQELSECDRELREGLIDSARTYGLVVVGYSGRDKSVMDALADAIAAHGERAFPEGLYWCVRNEADLSEPVRSLLETAASRGIRAAAVRITDFDDFAAGLYRACKIQHEIVDATLAARQHGRRGYDLHRSGRSEPLLKLNAIPVRSYPESIYRFRAEVGGWDELRNILRDTEVVGGLHGGYVNALGRRSDVEALFGPFQLTDLQLAPVMIADLRRPNSVVLGVFYDAITRALSTNAAPLRRPATAERSRLLHLRRENALPADLLQLFADLGLRDSPSVVRRAKRAEYWVHEAIRLSLEYREDHLWLLYEPTVFLSQDGEGTPWEGAQKAETVRELQAQRYNKQLSGLLTFWLRVIGLTAPDGVIRFPAAADGFRFQLQQTVGYSHHQG